MSPRCVYLTHTHMHTSPCCPLRTHAYHLKTQAQNQGLCQQFLPKAPEN